jgi:hypothetical protein
MNGIRDRGYSIQRSSQEHRAHSWRVFWPRMVDRAIVGAMWALALWSILSAGVWA